jgi:chloramphenicol O-acetyltransferase type B
MDKIWYLIFKCFYFLRAKLLQKAKIYYTYAVKKQCKSFELPLKVNGYSIVNNNTILGCNVNFNGMKVGGAGNVRVGNNFHSGVGCKMITQIHNYEGKALPYDKTLIQKDIIIGDNVWLGDNVTLLGGINIGEGVIIQAGSVVVSDIPALAIAGGHPAKVFKYRDIEHYNSLKGQNKFH